MKLAERFCDCVKQVRRTVKTRKGSSGKEQAAIAICVKSVLQKRGRTLKKFRCRGKNNMPSLVTQPLK